MRYILLIMNNSHNRQRRMAEGFSRVHLTGDEVLDLLDMDGDDGGMDDIFFPGSDDELGFLSCFCLCLPGSKLRLSRSQTTSASLAEPPSFNSLA